MIFPNLELEKVVQVNDKTRLSATKTYISKGEFPISKVEIEPEAGAGFITVTGTGSKDWYLDWQYDTDGEKSVTVQVTTTDISGPTDYVETFLKTIECLTIADDNLFSGDDDLIEFESDVLRYVRDGRNSWLDFHRKAQELIVSFFDERGNVTINQEKLTKENFKNTDEVLEWSTVLTLRLIFEHLSTQGGERFALKAQEYRRQELERRTRMVVRMDLDGDGFVSAGEHLEASSVRLLRR